MYYPDLEKFKKHSKDGNVIPVYREILADMETPVTALMKLREKPHVFLLESVEGGEKWARYSFVGADPKVIFEVSGDEVLIRDNGNVQRLRHEGRPLMFLQNLLSRYLPVAVGFGISTPDQATAIAPHADGIVVGSAIVKMIEESAGNNGLIPLVSSFAGAIKMALPSGRCGISRP